MSNLSLRLLWIATLASVALSSSPLLSRASTGAPIAVTKNGSYYGVSNSVYNQDFFFGIPFAQPPLGDLRFANPVSVNTSWTGALPATSFAYVSLIFNGLL